MSLTNIFFNNKVKKPEIYCKFCGVNINLPKKYMYILYELHFECWKYYRMNDILYPKLKYF